MTDMTAAADHPVISIARRRHGGGMARDAAVAGLVAVVLAVAPMAMAQHAQPTLHPQLAQATGEPPVPLADALIGKWDVQDNGCTDSFHDYRTDGTLRIAYRTGDRWDLSALRPVGRYSLDGSLLTTITDRLDGAVVDTVVQTIRIDYYGRLARRNRTRTSTASETGETINLELRPDSIPRCPESSTVGADAHLDRSLVVLERQVAAARAFAADHPEAAALRDQMADMLNTVSGFGAGGDGAKETAGHMLPLAETDTGYRLVLPVFGAAGEAGVGSGAVTVDFAVRADGRLDMAVTPPNRIVIETGTRQRPSHLEILLGETAIAGVWDPDFAALLNTDILLGDVAVVVDGRPAARFGAVTLVTNNEMTADDRMTTTNDLSISDIEAMETVQIDRISIRSGTEDFIPSMFFQNQKAVNTQLMLADRDTKLWNMLRNTEYGQRVWANLANFVKNSLVAWRCDLSMDGIRIVPDAAMAGPVAGWSIGRIDAIWNNEVVGHDEASDLSTWVVRVGMDAIQAAPHGLPPNLMRLVPRRLGFTVAIENFPALGLAELMAETAQHQRGVPWMTGMRFEIDAFRLLHRARFGLRLGDFVLDAPAAGIEGDAVFSLDSDNPNLGDGRIDLEIRGLDTVTETARATGASARQLAALELLTAVGLPIEGHDGDYRYDIMLNNYIFPMNLFEAILVNDRDVTSLLDALQDM